MSQFSNAEIQEDFEKFLNKFNFKEEIRIKAFEVTRWHNEPESLGSYSYFKVGSTVEDINMIRSPIEDKIWFIG
jgi:hypothetical protein